MPKKWRPDNWKNPYLVGADLIEKIYEQRGMPQMQIYAESFMHDGYEASADAMLEVLYERCKREKSDCWMRFDKTDNGDILIYKVD